MTDDQNIRAQLSDFFVFVFEQALIDEIIDVGVYREFPPGQILMDIGQKMDKIPLLIDGALKIVREDENGDEILLYFLERGDTCAVSFGAGIAKSRSKIRAVTEKDASIIFLPQEKLDEWLVKYSSWRNFVLESYQLRMGEMVDTIDTLAFMQMDQRVMKYLRDKAQILRTEEINTTHKEIAEDLNTSRVVISRVLKGLEKQEKLKIHRNRITILEF